MLSLLIVCQSNFKAGHETIPSAMANQLWLLCSVRTGRIYITQYESLVRLVFETKSQRKTPTNVVH